MAGTVVHMAFAGLLAAAFLGAAYDWRAVAVVLAVTALPDLDAFVALVSSAGHRAALHNVVLPAVAAGLLWIDTTRRSRSAIRERFGARGVRIAWVSIVAFVASGVGLDAVSGSVNPLYPLHDQFYSFDGEILLSDQRGLVQTFVEWSEEESVPAPQGQGSTQEVELSTGVNPDPSDTETDPERIFPIVRSGWQLLVLVVGTAATLARFKVRYALPSEE